VTRKFFRGRRAQSGGSGLGLAIAERIAEDHGGVLSVQSRVDAGTTVRVTLPVSRRSR
jgi:signal transduction histidine kinase